jgi:hypothetical protein
MVAKMGSSERCVANTDTSADSAIGAYRLLCFAVPSGIGRREVI